MEKKQIGTGAIVQSLKGHDTGKIFIVVSVVNQDFVMIADGKSRRADLPKLKRAKHLRLLRNAPSEFKESEINDTRIARIIKLFKGEKNA